MNFPTPDFLAFSTMNWTFQQSGVEKSRDRKLMVEKSGVENSCVEKSGVDISFKLIVRGPK